VSDHYHYRANHTFTLSNGTKVTTCPAALGQSTCYFCSLSRGQKNIARWTDQSSLPQALGLPVEQRKEYTSPLRLLVADLYNVTLVTVLGPSILFKDTILQGHGKLTFFKRFLLTMLHYHKEPVLGTCKRHVQLTQPLDRSKSECLQILTSPLLIDLPGAVTPIPSAAQVACQYPKPILLNTVCSYTHRRCLTELVRPRVTLMFRMNGPRTVSIFKCSESETWVSQVLIVSIFLHHGRWSRHYTLLTYASYDLLASSGRVARNIIKG
jgi:hypothetical protein